MKVLSTPPPIEEKLHWSVGRKVRCYACSAVLEIEKHDATPAWAVRSLGGDQGAQVTCGHCGKRLELRLNDNRNVKGMGAYYPSHEVKHDPYAEVGMSTRRST